MASRTRQVGVARSRLLGKADRNRHRYAVAVASGIWRPERAVRLIRRSPEKSRNEPSSPICIAYLAFQSRIILPASSKCPFRDMPAPKSWITAYPEAIFQKNQLPGSRTIRQLSETGTSRNCLQPGYSAYDCLIEFPDPDIPEADRLARVAVRLQLDRRGVVLLVKRLADV